MSEYGVLGEPDPETMLLSHLHLPQWKRGLKLARALVRTSRTDEQVIDCLIASCPGEIGVPMDWWRRVLAELVKLAKRREGLA